MTNQKLIKRLDHAHVWHPFTQMRDWLREEPIVVVRGVGARLWDAKGREYLDANSSIWTNLHGHNHPVINRAITKQLAKVAHTSALGLANEPASHLAEALIGATTRRLRRPVPGNPRLKKVFFSDDGSTAMETALKLAYEFIRRTRGPGVGPRFLSLEGAYHGDTVGAVSLGHIKLFHQAYRGLLFRTDSVMSPYCYRCPFNRAKPQRNDARLYRKCRWECVDQVAQKLERARRQQQPYHAFVFEPRIQGAAGMIAQPAGWLARVGPMFREHGALMVADEVMTGCGRAGENWVLASQAEGVTPDLVALAKGLTGGYLPMAATLTTQAIFDAFMGEYREFKTFFHGHSFTGNQLGAAAANASLKLVESKRGKKQRAVLGAWLDQELQALWTHSNVGDIRRVGLVAGIELVRDWRTREPFSLAERAGIRVCEVMARHGVLTRPIGNVITLLPPFVTTRDELGKMVGAIRAGLEEAFGKSRAD